MKERWTEKLLQNRDQAPADVLSIRNMNILVSFHKAGTKST